MSILNSDFMQGFIRMCNDAWQQGWHECHGGNLTYRLTGKEVAAHQNKWDTTAEWTPLTTVLPGLANEYFVTTGSGQFMRNVTLSPARVLGIIRLNSSGNAYQIVWGLQGGGKPTSELPAHLMNHEVKKEVTKGHHRVIYHAHPANIIALSFILPLTDAAFTRQLWEMEPECAMTFPAGIGVLPWMVPGTTELARLTCEKMREYDVVLWAQHGLFTAADTYDNTFGLMHTVEKTAEILVKVLAMGGKRQAPTTQNFCDMAKAFNLTLPPKFLGEER